MSTAAELAQRSPAHRAPLVRAQRQARQERTTSERFATTDAEHREPLFPDRLRACDFALVP